MTAYFSDDDMLRKEQFYTFGCLGGMAEGFDYSECRALLKYWSVKRQECKYRGGEVEEINGSEALAMFPDMRRRSVL